MRKKRIKIIVQGPNRATYYRKGPIALHVKEPTLEETEQMMKEIIEDCPKLFGVPKELMKPIK